METEMAKQGGRQDKASQTSNEDMKRGQSGSAGQQQAEPGSDRQQSGSHRGGSGNFANDRDRASEAGRKGGRS
jgi:general stress protein YciG